MADRAKGTPAGFDFGGEVRTKWGMRFLLAGLLFLVFSGCTTPFVDPSLKLTEESEYYTALDKFTIHKQVYDGFNATIDFHIYFLNSYLSRYQLDQNARIYQWNAAQYQTEKEKADAELAHQTTYYVTFFTPDRHNDDLQKEKTTKWRVFLDVNGNRYQAKIDKLKTPFAELSALYRQHNRWSSLYKFSFPVPSASVEPYVSKITVTGPVGHAEVEFQPVPKVIEQKED